MNILALADIHGNDRYLPQITGPLKEADLVLLAGDITNFGGRDEVRRVIEVISRCNSNILAVHGNCDLPAVEEQLREMGVNLDSRQKTINDILFVGIGGSLPSPGRTPNEMAESVFTDILDTLSSCSHDKSPLVLVTHQPPYGTKIDTPDGSRHTGSRAIRRFIERVEPILALSGHIHEARGVDQLNSTVLVNPGPFRNGFYAFIEINERLVRADLRSV